jgi:hypothetical protein
VVLQRNLAPGSARHTKIAGSWGRVMPVRVGPHDLDRLRRVAARLAEQAQAGDTSADDRPVLDDLRVGPRTADGNRRGWGGADRSPVRRWRDRRLVARGVQRQELDDVKGRPPPHRAELKRPDREERTTVTDRGMGR